MKSFLAIGILAISLSQTALANDEAPKDGFSVNDLRKRQIGGTKISNKTHFNPADPEATLSGKAGESKSLAYKTHHAIDAGSRVVVDCHVTTGSVSDVTMFIERINHIEEKYQLKIGEVILRELLLRSLVSSF